MPISDQDPLRVLVLADLQATREQRGAVELGTAADFEALLAELAPAARLQVPNRLGSSPPLLDVELKPGSLRDLSPAGLLERVPALAPARRLVELLGAGQSATALAAPELDRLGQELNVAATGGAPAPGSPPSHTGAAARPADAGHALASGSPSSSDRVARILDLVDLPSTEERAASVIGKVVGAIGRRASTAGNGGERRSAVQVAAAALGEQLDLILHHPEARALEAAWRGLRFLVNRCELCGGVRLAALHLPRAALRGEDLIEQVRASITGPGPDLLLAATLFEDPAADAVVAERLGELAAELRAPLVFSVGLPFFGPPAEHGGLRLSQALLEPAEYLGWRALRQREPARWLGAICNRFLLRPPHSTESGGLAWSETVSSPRQRLWGDPVFLVGALACRSFARVGWPTEILGAPGGRLEDLPVWPLPRPGRPPRSFPLEQALSMEQVQLLGRSGFMALYAAEDTDAALLLAAPPLFHQPAPGPRRGPSIGFCYQALAGRVVRLVEGWRAELAGRSLEEQTSTLEHRLRALLAGSGPGAAVRVSAAAAAAGTAAPEVGLELKLGTAVLGGVSLELRFALPG